MARSVFRSQRAFPVAVGVTVVAALLPTGWLGWTSVLANVVAVPLQPLVDGGVRVSQWLRPAAGDPRESEALRQAVAELETTRALLHAARIDNEGLLEEIEALQEARRFQPNVEMTPLYARVTGRAPDGSGGPVRINAGSRHGVVPDAIAVYRGGHLMGRVAGNVSRLSSPVVPITDRAIGLMEGFILPADDPRAELATAPRLQLTADGNGGLVGDLDKTLEVNRGDVVRLADPAWPQSAQGMIIGFVESIETKDLQPLLNSVTVRPRYHARRVASMTLIVERYGREAEGGAP